MGRYDDYDDRDRQHSFMLTCSECACRYSNLDGVGCPNCGSCNCSYASEDASRWNDYADRQA
jgi:rRNA maturation endonuclease Nob1